jgi:beta-barrel assembly-enhancing protease
MTAGRRAAGCALAVSVLVTGCSLLAGPRMPRPATVLDPIAEARRIVAETEREEARITQKTTLYDDPDLEAYLAELGARLVPDAARAGGHAVRFTIVRDPALNAFAMPDGHVYVHTGLLSLVENESQLAIILTREIAHVVGHHAIESVRASGHDGSRAAQAFALISYAPEPSSQPSSVVASIGPGMSDGGPTTAGDRFGPAAIGPMASVILGDHLELAAAASMSGHGPALEREADAASIAALIAAGYDPRPAADVFAVLAKHLADRGPLERFLLGRRAALAERNESIQQLLASQDLPSTSVARLTADPTAFGTRMQTLVRDNAELDIRAGRFALAQRQLERVLAMRPRDPVVHLYQGELHRLVAQRAGDTAERAEHARQALESYERSVALEPGYAAPYRQLGLLHFQAGDSAGARTAFARYLELAPEAPDAPRIKEYLAVLGQ